MARWITYPEVADEVDGTGVLEHIGSDIRDAAAATAPHETGDLAASGHIDELDRDHVTVLWDAAHPDEPGAEGHYSWYVDVGTSDTPATRFIERAFYRYRS